MDLYHVLEMIGEGSFGRVYKGRKKFSGQVVALKFIPKVGRSEKELRNLKREIDIMRGLQHPNIVLLLDSFETEREVVVVTEYAEGELFQILEDDGNLPESQVREIACQLVSALYYLHSHRILHRDMKPQNILLGKGGVVKLCDFGFARAMSVSTLVLTSIKGTPLYMSPELVEEKPYDHTADLWSLGCILYELHTGAPPFYTNSIFQLVQLIVRDPVKWPDTMSQTCTTFLKGLLTKDPQKRLSWPHLLKHPFVADGVLVLSDPVASSPLTVAPSLDLQTRKLQQAAQKAAPHGGEGRLLRKAREQRDKRSRQVGNGKTESSSQAPSRKPLSKDSLVAPSDGLDQDLSQLTANLSLTPKQSASERSTNRGQISRDYEQEFPSVEIGPRQALRRPETEERGQARTSLSAVRLHSQDVDSDEEWERLIQQTSVSSGQTIQIIPRLKEKLLTSKTLLLDGILEGACQIRQPLKVLSNLILTSDSEDSHRLRQEVGLPNFLFNLVRDIVENPVVVKQPWSVTVLGEVIVLLLNYWEKNCDWQQAENKLEDYAMPFFKILLRPDPNPLAPLAAAVLAIFSQCGVSVDVSMDRITAQLNKLLSDSDEPRVPLPPGWGFCDGFLSLVLHTLTENENPPHSASLDPSILRLLWAKVGTSLEKTSAKTEFCSSNGLYVFLSLALFVLTRDPYSCVPLFSDSDTNCILTLGHLLTTDCIPTVNHCHTVTVVICGECLVSSSVSRPSEETHGQLWGGDSSVNSLSVLSCHLLCFPFALDLSSETMDRLLQLYHSAGIVSGLLQVVQSVPPSLLELPLSLLCRLLLCDPSRSVPCFTAATRAQGFFSPPSSDPKEDRRDQAPASRDQAGHPVSVSRTASSLLSALLKPDSEALWGSAVELLTLLSQAARCSPRSRPSTPHLHLETAPLHQALAHPDDRVRSAACSLLGNLDPFTPPNPPSTSDPQRTRLQPAILRDIIGCLHDPSASVRRMACRAVGNWLGLIGKAGFRTRRASGREASIARITARDRKKGKPDKTVSSQSLVGARGDSSTTLKQQVADQEDGSGWVKEANGATTKLLSLITDPDALTRRHCCAALGNMAAVEGGVASLLEGDVPLLLLQAACTDSQHAVQRAAVTTLGLYSQQDALRQALLSLDAREKLRQASQHVAPPQCDYCQIIKLL
ncbi:serine/threonine-protein kinase 36 isoform X2 [Coregonus clupeaformis]|uniref:serine/threonine-protein kinase 36 isoform X2 n=1 Tax=Coregonus clupeaformis TaxID=59861 RepID=UPI001BDFED39|nr:serine/threonine-protein kinase 36 isoform X2 [Coregonus clupeaformis]